MDSIFFENIYNHPSILKSEYQEIINSHSKVECSKNQTIVHSGSVCNAYYLIESGVFRSSIYNYNGDEVTTGFFNTHEVLIDSSSLFQRIPALESIQAVTDGVLWKIEYEIFKNYSIR